jgi:CRISPR-associated protein Cas2
MFMVVFYDVPAKRTNVYRKLLSRYLTWRQNSVFAGDLTEALYKKMRREIDQVLDMEDRLAFVTTANRHNIVVEMLEQGVSGLDDSHQGSAVM